MRNTPDPESIPRWEARYRRKQAHRGRGLADLEERVGDVCAEIDARLAGQRVVRVLELGCGYAIALLDLVARYGSRVETSGINLREENGQDEILHREAKARRIEVDAQVNALPSIVHGDVAQGLPFADGTFDLVVSQVAWRYFRNKIGVLREVVRVLRADGLGLIDADEFDAKLPPEYGRLVEIWDDGRLVTFGDYLLRHGAEFAPARDGTCVRLGKCEALGEDLALRFEVDASQLHPLWDGIKCVYVKTEPRAPTAARGS
jgi:SAM-dependent methyltransferase